MNCGLLGAAAHSFHGSTKPWGGQGGEWAAGGGSALAVKSSTIPEPTPEHCLACALDCKQMCELSYCILKHSFSWLVLVLGVLIIFLQFPFIPNSHTIIIAINGNKHARSCLLFNQYLESLLLARIFFFFFCQVLSQQSMIIMERLTIIIGHCTTLYGFHLQKQAAIQW